MPDLPPCGGPEYLAMVAHHVLREQPVSFQRSLFSLPALQPEKQRGSAEGKSPIWKTGRSAVHVPGKAEEMQDFMLCI